MKSLQEMPAHILVKWSSYASIQRWRAGLLDVTGLTPAEFENRREALFSFCLARGIDPEIMAEECRKGEDRTACCASYLSMAHETPANLIVQSFLVHNGVNVFGDLVCMPGTREQLVAEQGARWLQDFGIASDTFMNFGE